LLYEHPKVETDGARTRLIGFDTSTITVEIFCYILTRDSNEFLAIREDLLLRIMDMVFASGTSFGLPVTTLNLSGGPGVDKEKAENAVQQVQKWREDNQLPFPDHAPKEISEFSNSLPYPPPGSAVGNVKQDSK
jgi:MscS family membrane protein